MNTVGILVNGLFLAAGSGAIWYAKERPRVARALWLLGLGLLLLSIYTGCASSLMSRTPVTETAQLLQAPPVVYAQALTAFTRMGGQLQVADAHNRTLAGIIHGAVALTVHIDNHSLVEVTGTLLPGKLVVGSMTEPADFLALLQTGRDR